MKTADSKLLPGVKMTISNKTEGQQIYTNSLVTIAYKCKITEGPKKGNSCGE